MEDILNIYVGSFNIILKHTNQKIWEFQKKWHSIGLDSLLFFANFYMSAGLSLKFPVRPSPI